MPTYRPSINKETLKQLEHYKFRLAEFIDSPDFKHETTMTKQKALLNELSYIDMTISVSKSVFGLQGTEKAIVGWPNENPNEKDGYMKIYHFTSATLAAKILNFNSSKINAVCHGKRISTGGEWKYDKTRGRRLRLGSWTFKFIEDYYEEDKTVQGPVDPKLPFFDIIKM